LLEISEGKRKALSDYIPGPKLLPGLGVAVDLRKHGN
jgi:hypothetical protein